MTHREKKRAAVIDVNPINRILLQEMLYELGFGSVIASDWIGGISVVIHQKPDLVIVDLDLDEPTKATAAAELEEGFAPTAPILLGMTSAKTEEELSRYRKIGFCGFLYKPFTTADLARNIEEEEGLWDTQPVMLPRGT